MADNFDHSDFHYEFSPHNPDLWANKSTKVIETLFYKACKYIEDNNLSGFQPIRDMTGFNDRLQIPLIGSNDKLSIILVWTSTISRFAIVRNNDHLVTNEYLKFDNKNCSIPIEYHTEEFENNTEKYYNAPFTNAVDQITKDMIECIDLLYKRQL